MVQSLAIKIGMLLITVLLVTWIGWSTPHDPVPVPDIVSAEAETEQQPIVPREEPTVVGRPVHRTASIAPTAERPPERPAKLDLNRATAEELQRLPGIGPVLAQRVLEQRITHGRFQTIDDLQDVKGIGKKRMDQLRPLVMVGVVTKAQPKPEATKKAKAL